MIFKNSVVCVLMIIVSLQAVVFGQPTEGLFSPINSQVDEQHPMISPDGQTLYFTRAHHELNNGGTRDQGDIWYSTLQENSQWSPPRNLSVLNNSKWNGVIGFGENGRALYLMGHYGGINGDIRSQGISKSIKKGNSWSTPKDIKIPYFKNLSTNFGAFVSPDETVLLMALESYGTVGAEDIYVSLRDNTGKWTEPRNLGRVINSKFQEFTPYLSDDKKTLYFSSNGHGGAGSSDVFSSERLDDTWRNWSKPVAVSVVNSQGRELGYKSFAGLSLYTSTISSDGYGDIKMYSPQDVDSVLKYTEPDQIDTAVQITEVAPEIIVENPNDVTLYGKVFNATNKALIKAEVSITSEGEKKGEKVSTSKENDYYSLNIKSAGEYLLKVEAPGYVSHQESLDIFSKEVKLLEMNFELQPIKVGTKVNLRSVLFKQSTSQILTSSYPELLLVVDLMKSNPSMRIRLEGHTDNRGPKNNNLKLSKSRAKEVQKYLVSKGIPARRISWKGYGGEKPIADNEDPEKRKMNRRVEFTIIKE